MLETVLRPFLENWQARYRHWWTHESDTALPPFRRQREFPRSPSSRPTGPRCGVSAGRLRTNGLDRTDNERLMRSRDIAEITGLIE